jgi:hypothetical protein
MANRVCRERKKPASACFAPPWHESAFTGRESRQPETNRYPTINFVVDRHHSGAHLQAFENFRLAVRRTRKTPAPP